MDGVRVPQWLMEVERRQRLLALLDPSRTGEFADEPPAAPPAGPAAAKSDPFESLDVANSRLALPVLFAAFHDGTDPNGDRAAQLLTRYNPEVVPVFVEALKEKRDDPVIRRRAMLGLGGAGDAAAPAVPVLRDLLAGFKDKADPERATVLQILTPFAGVPPAVARGDGRLVRNPLPHCRGLVGPAPPRRLQGVAAGGPVRLGPGRAIDPGDERPGRPSPRRGRRVARFVGPARPRQANNDLFKRLASRDVAGRARAAYAIAG